MGVEIAISYAAVTFVAAIVGMSIPLMEYRQLRKFNNLIVALLAGFLLGFAFMDLIPGAIRTNVLWASLGLVLLPVIAILVEQFKSSTEVKRLFSSLADMKRADKAFLIMVIGVFTALTIHAGIEGLAIGTLTGLDVPIFSGLGVAMGVALHKIPEGLAIGWFLSTSGFSRNKLLSMVLIFAVATPVATLFGYQSLFIFPPVWQAFIFGIVGAVFIYFACVELWRKMAGGIWTLPFFLIGLLGVFLSKVIVIA